MNRLSNYFPLIIAALLAALTFWLEQVVRNEHLSGLGTQRHDPDLIANGVSVDRFDTDGRRVSRMLASELKHYPDDDTAELSLPVVTLSRDAQTTVFSSKTAHADNQNKVVVMQSEVRGVRSGVPGKAPQTLETEELTVLTEDEIAHTDHPITMSQDGSVLTGVGAEWNNLTGVFTVKNQVRAVIPPRARRPKP